ncbi:malic enzyme, partial [Toxoplasma gondii RUB]
MAELEDTIEDLQ